MKNILAYSLVTMGLLSNVAFADFTPFNTIAQAEQHCPPITALQFTPTNPKIQNSKGTVSSNFNDMPFQAKNVIAPQLIDGNNMIQHATFRMSDNMYGYISNLTTVCFYTYPNFAGQPFYLILTHYKGHK